MKRIIFDTSVYINALRKGNWDVLEQRRGESDSQTIWLSAVVLKELYVGAIDGRVKKLLEKFEKDFEKINRLIMPNQNDWADCGKVLSLIGRKHGFETVRQARMTNDCLIAMTTARNGLKVFTHNAEDFKIISEFRTFEWQKT